jgi:hypothetical protein
MSNVIMLSVSIPNVIMLSVIMPNVIMLNVVLPNVAASLKWWKYREGCQVEWKISPIMKTTLDEKEKNGEICQPPF